MPISLVCSCGYKTQVKEEFAGRNVKCPACEATIQVRDPNAPSAMDDDQFLSLCEAAIQVRDPNAPATPPPIASGPAPSLLSAPVENRIWHYKVLTQKDKWFSGKFDPERLEQALNAYAKQGWRMRGMATASVPGFGGNRDELIFVLER